ncbi:histidinol dehydrogenase [Actibacterium sp. 188UL27-1]|uniref:histidinol dehydrogenase n=1 Tax=Actibacterium sp. 188UL27-1 TaxID=2786961 RepID=UPI00195BBE76|nr:histidinol dehydrogenase [Actibacterium sp. 188UL27-1]MBM7066738.1 histidinol dehydrogenase [Actibacterium sp. 188UL27-1]
MAVTYLKRATHTARTDHGDVAAVVSDMLTVLEAEGDEATRRYAQQFDQWDGEIIVAPDHIAAAAGQLSEQDRADIGFAHDNIRRFAEAQLATVGDTQIDVVPGLTAGQRQIPVGSVGAYVPGGRYAHIASALMTITTARVAGARHIMACSPPTAGQGIPPAILYAMDLAGADTILNLGGVQGLAAMAFGQFGGVPADILVGPGNAYVAEAKRQLFGRVGIDMIAGPTDSMVLADDSCDAEVAATDLVSQAEHGPNSPVWLVTTDKALAEAVLDRVPELIEDLPAVNRDAGRAAWRDYGEVILCDTREEVAAKADEVGPEHLQVMARDLDWWLGRLRSYGSLFLGEETTVAMGDKASGPNHVLPTSGSARYTGGLSVHKFLKTVTWQRATAEGMRPVAEATARLSRLEGMEAHARSADIRLERLKVLQG